MRLARKYHTVNSNAYSEMMSPNADAVAQIQAVLTRIDAQLDILRTFVAALTDSEISALSLIAVSAHLDQLEAAAATLAAHPTFTASVLQTGEVEAGP